jgi:hypothetical protein
MSRANIGAVTKEMEALQVGKAQETKVSSKLQCFSFP